MASPLAILKANRREAIQLAGNVGVVRMRALLQRAQTDLNQRLKVAEGLRGPGTDSFSAIQMRVTLHQIDAVLRPLMQGLKGVVQSEGKRSAGSAVGGVVDYLKASEKRFGGVNERLALHEGSMLERSIKGANSSVLHRLMGDAKKGPGILRRYGDETVQRFEESLQQRFVARQPWAHVRDQLTKDSPFLQGVPGHWAERIVRTEVMAAHNVAGHEAMQDAEEQLDGEMARILCATFDARTGSDSIAVHGQIRRLTEPFNWWEGAYMTPPNRPNDREVVVAHLVRWPIPPELAWRSDGEVSARWQLEGRKGGPPRRPKMTTIPLDQFGKASEVKQPVRARAGPAPEPEAPKRRTPKTPAEQDAGRWELTFNDRPQGWTFKSEDAARAASMTWNKKHGPGHGVLPSMKAQLGAALKELHAKHAPGRPPADEYRALNERFIEKAKALRKRGST